MADPESVLQAVFRLNDEDWRKSQEALERPAVIKSGLKKLLEEKAPWEVPESVARKSSDAG